ncbi:MAG: tagaturonate reductase, partial [Ruthenibacterium sp.]
LPFAKANLPILVTDDHTPYKKRKVRILNGAHTSMVLAAHLCGQTIVRDCMADAVIKGFMDKTVQEEIMPTLTLPKQELIDFANAVGERFNNPFIDHALLAIALNSTSKWKARVLPSFHGYIEKYGKLPVCMTLSLAAYIAFYRAECDKNAKDDASIIDFYKAHKQDTNAALAAAVLSNDALWGEKLSDIAGLTDAVTADLDAIDKNGMYETLKSVL